MRSTRNIAILAGIAAALAAAGAANADVVISSAATSSMACSNGVCAPTAKDATLNVTDLENLLASGNVKVTTTGSGVQANNITVGTPLSWSATNTLALDASRSITINKTLSVDGQGGLSLITNDGGAGGALSFGPKGHAVIANLSSPLTINGTAYTLVNSVQTLASAIAANPSGDFALANNYDAKVDGTYSAAPVQTGFTGEFEGLGNAISHLSINGSGYIGLFEVEYGVAENMKLIDVRLTVSGGSQVGGFAGVAGDISRVSVSGTIRGIGNMGNDIGGVTAIGGNLVGCSSNIEIIENQQSAIGGLASIGDSDQSFAAGTISATADGSIVGGLISTNEGTIQNSYASIAVTGGSHTKIGGLVGTNGQGKLTPGIIQTSYSSGAVSDKKHGDAGGFVGVAYKVHGQSEIEQSYWDTTTSGTDKGTGRGNKKGITGLTTEQLQSGLPDGFDPKVWAEDPKINNGLPYLINNPPEE
ncbi:MAG TPA: hypothetical protein VHY79_10135 [Rhizomicrobium sp.]|jgi:hypothetical protein|nr:hypothetical protein [Rhizomicrobium sp.]